MKIIRKSLLNLIYILFILILTLSCSNDELIENDNNSNNELNNAQIKINDLTQKIETLQNLMLMLKPSLMPKLMLKLKLN